MDPTTSDSDPINPDHYKDHPSGVECIEITRWFSFCAGSAIKYIWRAGIKNPDPVPDLRKAIRFLEFEIDRLERGASVGEPDDYPALG